MRGVFFIIQFFLLTFFLRAQMSVSTNSNANTLVNNIVGSGVQISNVSINCNSNASGTFSAVGTNLGITQGIVLGTGKAIEAIGPNNSSGGGLFHGDGCFNENESFFDSDILNIESLAKYDGCILEFDIQPACSTLTINYVFASEEYPEYIGAGYNDVFGFFVSGPNPTGGNYNAYNIARIPGTNLPVSIDNINGQSYSNLYVDNANGNTVQYDGFTVPLVATVNVIPCQNYHLKLAIADAGDCDWSSAVFLSYQGLTCQNNQVPILSSSSIPVSCSSDGSASVSVSNYSGGLTYNWQPGGQNAATASNLSAGTYTCTVSFTSPCPFTQTISVNVSQGNVLNANTSSTSALCGNASGTASVAPFGGSLPYVSVSWNIIPAQNGLTATQLPPGTYTVSITDNNSCTISKVVTVNDSVPIISTQQTIQNTFCGQSNGSITINQVTGGAAPYTYSWNGSLPSGNNVLSNISSGNYVLLISDANNCLRQQNFFISDDSSLPFSDSIVNEKCNQSNGEIFISTNAGQAPYQFTWFHNTTLNSSSISNLSAGQYTVEIRDALGCFSIDTISIVNQNDIFAGSVFCSPATPIVNEPYVVGINLPGNWNLSQAIFPDGTMNQSTQSSYISSDFGEEGFLYYLLSENGCRDTQRLNVFVKDKMTIYIPNSFTPNGDFTNEEWKVYGTVVKSISVSVFNRWGELVFETNTLEEGWNGTVNGRKVQEDVYVYKVKALDYFDETKTYSGTIRLIR